MVPAAVKQEVAAGIDDARLESACRATVRGIVFDTGDVLFDATVWQRWLWRLLMRFGVRSGYESLFQSWGPTYLSGVYRGQSSYDEALAAFLQDLGLSCGQVAEVAAAARAKCGEFEIGSRLFPTVAGTLAQLHAGDFRLGVLADSVRSGDRLARDLEQLGLGQVFDAVVTSIDVGEPRPSLEGYGCVLETLGLMAEETVFVGHDATELAAASQAGMATVAFNHGADAVAHQYLERFDELPALLRHWPARSTAA